MIYAGMGCRRFGTRVPGSKWAPLDPRRARISGRDPRTTSPAWHAARLNRISAFAAGVDFGAARVGAFGERGRIELAHEGFTRGREPELEPVTARNGTLSQVIPRGRASLQIVFARMLKVEIVDNRVAQRLG